MGRKRAYKTGASKFTPKKQELLSKILDYHIRITKNTIEKHSYYADSTYHFIDANAGPGIYEGIVGSPIVFLQEAEKHIWHNTCYDATFIEMVQGKANQLSQHLRERFDTLHYGKYKVLCKDSDKLINSLPNQVDNNTFGLLYIDKNGRPDFDMICHFMEIYQKREVLIRFFAREIKLNHHNHGKRLSDFIDRLKNEKRNQLISRVDDSDSWQSFFLLCSASHVFKAYPKIGLYKIGTSEAQETFDKLNLFKSEFERRFQLPLF